MKNFLLIDDHQMVRMGLKYLLSSLFEPCGVYEAADEKSAVDRLKERSYDLVITDIQMPDSDILGLMQYIKINYPATRVLVFSMCAENVYAKKFLNQGVVGFVSKTAEASELRRAIDLALNNRKYISPMFASQLTDEPGSQPINPFELLSAKEFDVCTYLAAGISVTEISKTLHLSTSTIGTHKAQILKKLKVKNVVELNELSKQHNLLG